MHADASRQAAAESSVSSQREHTIGPTGGAETKEVFGLALPRSGCLHLWMAALAREWEALTFGTN